jgi:predicted RNA-binding protein with PIN domain
MAATALCSFVALIRILVDGYSLLHNWPALAPGRPRHSEAARAELVNRLTLYQDAIETPITIVFDGNSLVPSPSAGSSKSKVEVLYSRRGQTADNMIERATHRLLAYGEVLAVTDDSAERETVVALGGLTSSCWNFIQSVKDALGDVADELKHHNRRELHRFQRSK